MIYLFAALSLLATACAPFLYGAIIIFLSHQQYTQVPRAIKTFFYDEGMTMLWVFPLVAVPCAVIGGLLIVGEVFSRVSLGTSFLHPRWFVLIPLIALLVPVCVEIVAHTQSAMYFAKLERENQAEKDQILAERKKLSDEHLESGVPFSAVDVDRYLALTDQYTSSNYISEDADSIEHFKMLLEKGVIDPDIMLAGTGPGTGKSVAYPLLMRMAVSNKPSYVRALLEYGADPNKKSETGETTLVAYVTNPDWFPSSAIGLPEIEALITCGADPNARTSDGKTIDEALETVRAKYKAEFKASAVESKAEIANRVRDDGGDPEIKKMFKESDEDDIKAADEGALERSRDLDREIDTILGLLNDARKNPVKPFACKIK